MLGGSSISILVGSFVCVVYGTRAPSGGQVGFGMDLVTGVLGDIGSIFLVLGDYPSLFHFLKAQNLVGNAPNIPILGYFSPNPFLLEVGYEGAIRVTNSLSSTPIIGSSYISCGPLCFKHVIVGINLSGSDESTGNVSVSSVDVGGRRSSVKLSKKDHLTKRHKKRPGNLIFGEGVTMDQEKSFSKMVLVGRAQGRNLGYSFLKSWDEEHWGGKLTSLLDILSLEKNWVGFFFHTKEDMDWVLVRLWMWLSIPFFLKKWRPTFDVA